MKINLLENTFRHCLRLVYFVERIYGNVIMQKYLLTKKADFKILLINKILLSCLLIKNDVGFQFLNDVVIQYACFF